MQKDKITYCLKVTLHIAIVAMIAISIVLVFGLAVFSIATFFDRKECTETCKATGYTCTYSFYTGCLAKIGNIKVPLDKVLHIHDLSRF